MDSTQSVLIDANKPGVFGLESVDNSSPEVKVGDVGSKKDSCEAARAILLLSSACLGVSIKTTNQQLEIRNG